MSDATTTGADDGEAVTAAVETAEEAAWIRRHITRLPPRERVVMQLYYAEGWTLAAIGRELGVTGSRVSQIRSGAVRALRGRIGVGVDAGGIKPGE